MYAAFCSGLTQGEEKIIQISYKDKVSLWGKDAEGVRGLRGDARNEEAKLNYVIGGIGILP